MDKQEKRIALQAAFDNGSRVSPIPDSMYELDAWILESYAKPEFRGPKTIIALSGYEHSNQWGGRHHVKLNFNNMLPAQADSIRSFLDLFQEKERLYSNTTAIGIGSNTSSITIAATLTMRRASPNNNVLNNLHLQGRNITGVLIQSSTYNPVLMQYTLQLNKSITYLSGDTFTITIPTSIPTIIRFSNEVGGTLTSPTNHFNLIDYHFGVNRDFTINFQRCTITLKGVHLGTISQNETQIEV